VVLAEPLTEDLDVEGCLRLDAPVDVTARLRLLPGTTVTAAEEAALWIGEGGSLSSEGTAEAPVIFVGEVEEPGDLPGFFGPTIT
jgi:hypothetical protein